MTINEMCKEAHETAVSKGWWEKDRNFGEMISLMHAELSEALEEYRMDNRQRELALEFADVLIRIGDYCGSCGLDLERAVVEKMEYNKTRPYRHGGKRA